MSNLSLVNSFYGVDPPGNCLPGPYRPFGLVRLSPDVAYGRPTSGYRSGRPILTFSHTHVAGTGGGGRYGNVGLMPFRGHPQRNGAPPFLQPKLDTRGETIPSSETGGPGYYTATLFKGSIRVELTSTPHVGVHRYTFQGAGPDSVLLSSGSVISAGAHPPGEINPSEAWDSGGVSIGGYLEVVSESELIGRSDFRGGWGHHKPYSIYFVARFSQPWDSIGLANRGGVLPQVGFPLIIGEQCSAALSYELDRNSAESNESHRNADARQLEVAVGISFVSVARARDSIDREVGDRSFDTLREEARNEWARHLDPVRTEGPEFVRRVFHSSHHRLLAMPTDLGINAENPFWKSGVRQFTDIYCLWDSVRNANSLLFLLEPDLSRDLLNALVDMGEQTGWIPDAHIACRNAYMQSGGSAPILFREAAAKGIEGVDYTRALELLKAESDAHSPDPMVTGRYNECYNTIGYVSDDAPKSQVSRHIEYAYYDWCIGKLAEQLGDQATADEYRARSDRLWNLWRADLESFAPKHRDGTWDERYEPDFRSDDPYNDPYFYESSGRSWTFNTFQDFPQLISRLGGPEQFVERLDAFYRCDPHASIPKETRMHIPLLYTYAGHPERTAALVHEMLTTRYSDTRDGLPDNEDMGCQSAFYMFYSAGLYPVMGQDLYILSPPLLERTLLPVGAPDSLLEIVAPGARPGAFIGGVRLNGASLDRLWLRHDEIRDGAQIETTIVDTPSTFGSDNLPPNGNQTGWR